MMKTFEESLGIIAVQEAISAFQSKYPQADLYKVQLEYDGPFLKYEMRGNDGHVRSALDLNAQTGDIIKEYEKPLKNKHKAPEYRERKKLNLDNLKPLGEINDIALGVVQVDRPIEWELEREKQWTVWEVEITSQDGSQLQEVKVDAQDGRVIEMKVKR